MITSAVYTIRMQIYVTRHGLTPLNKKKKVNGQIDEKLAPEGIQQAKEAISLLPQNVKHIYTSPLQRAKHTAEIINSNLKRPLTEAKELAEIHMGSLAGYSWEQMENGMDLKKKHRTVTFDYTPFGGESVDQVKKRLINFFQKIKKNHGDKEVLIVTHGGIIRTLYFLEHGNVVDETEKHVSLVELDLDKVLENSKNI